MHILYGCAHTRGRTIMHTIAPHTEQVLRGWLTFPFLVSFFFLCVSFIWFRLCWICLSMRFCLFIHFFSMLLLSFLQLHTKIQASHYLVNIMEAEAQFVSSNIEKAFEQCSCMWSDVVGTQHETIFLLIIKCIYFMNSYLECAVLGVFSDKVWELFDARPFPWLLFYAQTGNYFMYWYMPGLCREYVSSFDDCIPLETLSYKQLNGVSFSGMRENIINTNKNMYLSWNVSLCKNILEAKLLLTNVWPLFFFVFFGRPTRTFLLRVVKTIFSTHACMHTHTTTTTTSVWHLFFFFHFYDKRWRERESGRVIETNAQTHRMWCVRGLG